MTTTNTTREITTAQAQVKTEAPQQVFNKKKTIFRFNQVIWYILGLIEVLLIFRVVLKLLGANASVGFTSMIYGVTAPLAMPFSGIVDISAVGRSTFEWTTIIAAIVYLVIAWGLVYLVDFINPITPHDVEAS